MDVICSMCLNLIECVYVKENDTKAGLFFTKYLTILDELIILTGFQKI